MAPKPEIGDYEQGIIDTIYYLSRALGMSVKFLATKLKEEYEKACNHGQ